ncbi:MAG TPA: hypothetical protein PLH72_07495 [Vicinamibacterales bacterium]|nr:hypothetical protein [Vicinamibacterales bacterium]
MARHDAFRRTTLTLETRFKRDIDLDRLSHLVDELEAEASGARLRR